MNTAPCQKRTRYKHNFPVQAKEVAFFTHPRTEFSLTQFVLRQHVSVLNLSALMKSPAKAASYAILFWHLSLKQHPVPTVALRGLLSVRF